MKLFPKMTANLLSLFRRLAAADIKIAICTSDSREGTEEFLTRLQLDSLVDYVLCGDDAASIAKPNPHNALHICSELGCDPSQAIMVGDTPADTIMGQTAGLGLTVGVLTGVGQTADLTDADVIVEDVGQMVNLVCHDAAATIVNNVTVTARGLFKIAGNGETAERRVAM